MIDAIAFFLAGLIYITVVYGLKATLCVFFIGGGLLFFISAKIKAAMSNLQQKTQPND